MPLKSAHKRQIERKKRTTTTSGKAACYASKRAPSLRLAEQSTRASKLGATNENFISLALSLFHSKVVTSIHVSDNDSFESFKRTLN